MVNNQKLYESIEPLLTQNVNTNLKKDQAFESMKKEIAKVCNKLGQSTAELSLHTDSLKSNQQLLASILQRKTSKPSTPKRSHPEKFNPMASWSHHTSAPKIVFRQPQSPMNLSSGLGNFLRSPQEKDLVKSFNFEEQSISRTRDSKRFDEERTDRDLADCLAKIKDYEKFSESLSKRMTQLKASVSNFMVTCEKMLRISSEASETESYMIRTFDDEKHQLENNVYGLSEFIIVNKNKLRLKVLKSSEKDIATSSLQSIIIFFK